MDQHVERPEERNRRELRARILGVMVALAAAVIAIRTVGAPLLIVAALLGYGAYRLAGGGRR